MATLPGMRYVPNPKMEGLWRLQNIQKWMFCTFQKWKKLSRFQNWMICVIQNRKILHHMHCLPKLDDLHLPKSEDITPHALSSKIG